MSLLKDAKALIASSEVKDGTKDFLADTIATLLGDTTAAGRIMFALMESPFFFQEKIFWEKFELFISGVSMSEEERARFCAQLTEDGTKKDNPYRLIHAINNAETKQKIKYLINASRTLGAEFIDLSTYFRMCHAITGTVEEDLLFLIEHIQDETDFPYSDTIQGLLNVGLMRQSVIDANGNNRFVFTPFADILDQFALSYENVSRYPMVNKISEVSMRNLGQEVLQSKGIEITEF